MSEFSGTVQTILPATTYPKKDGTEGKRQTIVIASVGQQYPTILAIELNEKFADKIKVGEEGTFSFNVSSREYNGRYYTSANLWKWDKVGSTPNISQPTQSSPPVSTFTEDDQDSLPF